MAPPKALLRGSIAALLSLSVAASAQVSNVEGLKPLEGVTIPKIQTNKEIKPGTTFKDCDDCPEMVMIPAGSFFMGSENGGSNNERPMHRVQVQTFAIGKYEVTQAEWEMVMGNNPSSNKGRTLPVENISWDDTQAFVQKLSQKTGKNYRLPSEAEWEYAARGGSTTLYPWGDNPSKLGRYAWCAENAFREDSVYTRPVGLKTPNQFGLYDMLGNVWEWTQDCWNQSYAGAPADGSAWIEGECSRRMGRGGNWLSQPLHARTAYRDWSATANRFKFYGFRVARPN